MTNLDAVSLAGELKGPFDLSSDRKREATKFWMETKYVHFGMDGRRLGVDTYHLVLQYVPRGENRDDYRCLMLQVQTGNGPLISIPELSNWSYTFDPTSTGADGKGSLWGISQDRFAELTDGSGNALPFNTRYAVYTNFIDFHSINDVFAKSMKFGNGIQDLREIGQVVVHPASNIQASVSFGAELKPGSTFQNGEVKLELKGISLINGALCAIIGYDAGDSNLKMIVATADGEEAITRGVDQYKGDIHVDLATRMVRKTILDEYMVDEISASTSKTNEYTVRHIQLRLADT